MTKVLSYVLLTLYIGAACTNPILTTIYTLAALIAIPFFTEVVNVLFPVVEVEDEIKFENKFEFVTSITANTKNTDI